MAVDDLCAHLEDNYRLDTPVLQVDEIHIANHGEADVDVSRDQMRFIPDRSQPFYIKGTFAVFAVPFDGDAALFKCKPSTFSSAIPTGEIVGSEIHLRYESTDHNPERMRSAFDRDISQIQQHLRWIAESAVKFNERVRQVALERIEWRKDKLLKDQGMTTGLGFPVKRRENAPRTYAVPVSRRKLSVPKPVATEAPHKFEPALEMQEYERMLNIISNMEMVMERSPKAFAGMGEEDMRQHFLVQLNGQYEGQATGETFNFEGKTDILIRVDGRNIFIAECQFWTGPAGFRKTIDQLIGYTSWRDTKTAIILFNRNKDLSAVLTKIPEEVKAHPNFIKELPYASETGFRFVLHQRDDRNREIILTVLVFDVPA